MHNLKRIVIMLAVFATLIVVSVGFKGNDILQRGIVLGVGVDKAPDGVCVTVEVVSPGNGSEQVGMFSKTVTATGKTVAEGLQSIAEKTGKETSLGQCVLIVYGEEFVKTDFSDTANYFIQSDSCKESTMVCCCEGTAQEFLNRGDALSQSVSLSLADKLKGLAKDVALPTSDLLSFSRSQRELYRTGFLSFVRFEEIPYTNSVNPEQKQGYFVSQEVAVFRKNVFVGLLTKQETDGFAVLSKNVAGNVFSVVDEEEKLSTLRANTKNVSVKYEDGFVDLKVDVHVKLARTDSFGAGGKFTAKTESEITPSMLKQAKEQCLQAATLFLNKQTEWDFDLLGIHELFRRQYGTVERVKNFSMKEVTIRLSVSVYEK